MSRIEYKLSDLATEEQINWLNWLEDKIINCGNDKIDIIDDFGTDNRTLFGLISEWHITDGNKQLNVIKTYKRYKDE